MRSPLKSIGASSFSPSPITTTPSISTVASMCRIASTAARSAAILSPNPTQRAQASAAASVTRTSSSARFRSGASTTGAPPCDGTAERIPAPSRLRSRVGRAELLEQLERRVDADALDVRRDPLDHLLASAAALLPQRVLVVRAQDAELDQVVRVGRVAEGEHLIHARRRPAHLGGEFLHRRPVVLHRAGLDVALGERDDRDRALRGALHRVDDVEEARDERLGDEWCHRLVAGALGRLELALQLPGPLLAHVEEAERDYDVRVGGVAGDVGMLEAVGEALRLPRLS